MVSTEFVTLLEVSEGDDGRRASNLTSLAQLGASGHRIVITNALNRLKLDPGETINREIGMDVVGSDDTVCSRIASVSVDLKSHNTVEAALSGLLSL